MRFVPIKTDDQLDLQALHRVRDRLIARRTSVINQLRAFLLERGLVFAKSPARLRERMPEILENAEEDLTPRMRYLLAQLWNEWKDLEQRVVDLNQEVELIASSDAACPAAQADPWHRPPDRNRDRCRDRLRSCISQGKRVRCLDGAGAKAVLDRRQGEAGGVSKRGNRYLRKIFIHGTRAVVLRSKRDRVAMGEWMTALEPRAPRNVLIVATANKLPRIAWAVLSSGQDYRAVQAPVAA